MKLFITSNFEFRWYLSKFILKSISTRVATEYLRLIAQILASKEVEGSSSQAVQRALAAFVAELGSIDIKVFGIGVASRRQVVEAYSIAGSVASSFAAIKES